MLLACSMSLVAIIGVEGRGYSPNGGRGGPSELMGTSTMVTSSNGSSLRNEARRGSACGTLAPTAKEAPVTSHDRSLYCVHWYVWMRAVSPLLAKTLSGAR
jgi:hypothetical protein